MFFTPIIEAPWLRVRFKFNASCALPISGLLQMRVHIGVIGTNGLFPKPVGIRGGRESGVDSVWEGIPAGKESLVGPKEQLDITGKMDKYIRQNTA